MAIYVVIGSRIEIDHKELLSEVTEESRKSWGIVPEEFSSFDELRGAVAKHLSSKLPLLNSLIAAAATGNHAKFVWEHWRMLTPNVFVIGQLSMLDLLPNVKRIWYRKKETTETENAPQEEFLRLLAWSQTYVWAALSDSLASGDEHNSSLEEDLQQFVDPFEAAGRLIAEAPALLFDMFDHLMEADPRPSDHSLFCMEAIRASLYAALEQPNPHATRWAILFFSHELACRVGGDSISPRTRALLISGERARSTIGFRSAWDAVIQWVSKAVKFNEDRRAMELRTMEQVATKAGYPDLIDLALQEYLTLGETQALQAMVETPLEVLIKLIQQKIKIAESEGESIENILEDASSPYAAWLVKHRRVDDLEALADIMLEWLGNTDNARAQVDAWLGAYLKVLRQPKRFLDRVGDTPCDWEYHLSLERRVRLWTERANALRLIGGLEDAFLLTAEIKQLLIEGSDILDREWAQEALYTTGYNMAILLRDTGSPDAAIALLNYLLERVSSEDRRIDLLQSLALAYCVLWELDAAIQCYDEALCLAVGPRAREAPGLRIARAAVLASLGRYEGSLQALKEFQPEPDADPFILITEASVWIRLLQDDDVLLPPEATDRVLLAYENLKTIVIEAAEHADVGLHLTALHLLAQLWEGLDKPKEASEQLWQQAYNAAKRYKQSPEVAVLLSLARYAYNEGQYDQGRSYLMEVPGALESHLGGILAPISAVGGSQTFSYALNALTRTIFDRSITRSDITWSDIRLIAELRRDAVGRVRRRGRYHRQAGMSALTSGLTAEVLAQLVPESGRVAILEWLDDGERIICLLTCIGADRGASSHVLRQPQMDIRTAIEKVRCRLNMWQLASAGDPFSFPAWQMLEEWLVEGLSPYLVEGDHIVFIEHRHTAGAPWHVAAAPRWTSSYAASWTTLLSLRGLAAPSSATTLGVALVPCFNEAPKLLAAMRKSAQRTQAFAMEHKLNFSISEGEACDHATFSKIMNESNLVKLICHGFVPRNGEVALIIAHDGSLPLAATLVSSEHGDVYRLNASDLESLPTAPSVVFSAACSTGFSHVAGLDERLGLFNSLRYAGTRALVAPRWDIIPDCVLPILDDALERYLSGGVSLIQALHIACTLAEAKQPRWLAWALALEGDWQCNNH